MATMTIENGKEGAFRPAVTLFLGRFLHVEYDRDSVFVVVSHDSLVCVCSVGFHHAVLFDRVFGRLEVGKLHVRQVKRLGRGRIWSFKQLELVIVGLLDDGWLLSIRFLVKCLTDFRSLSVALDRWSNTPFTRQASSVDGVLELRELRQANVRASWACLGFSIGAA
jgi:hypothetical protein